MKVFSSIAAVMLAGLAYVSVDGARCASREANKRTAIAFLDESVNARDQTAAVRYTDGFYLQHNPNVPDGVPPFQAFVAMFTNETTAEFGAVVAEDDFVFLHTRFRGVPGAPPVIVVTDVFRFNDEGKIAEHWDVVQAEVPTSQTVSGRPMWPATSAVKASNVPVSCGDDCSSVDPQVEANKKTARALLDEAFNAKDPSAVDKYTDGIYLEHSPFAPDGPQGFKDFIGTLPAEAKVDFGKIVAEDDLVWLSTRVTGFPGFPRPTLVMEIFRFNAAGKIAEHWDIRQTEVPTEQTASGRPMFLV